MLQMIRCLKKIGRINIATDHVEFISSAGAEENELVGTNYERKYIKDARKI